jgi:hypothetical protein
VITRLLVTVTGVVVVAAMLVVAAITGRPVTTTSVVRHKHAGTGTGNRYLPGWIMGNRSYAGPPGPDLASAGYRGLRPQYLICGTRTSITGGPQPGTNPCTPGQVPHFTDVNTFFHWTQTDADRGYKTVLIDLEGWNVTPASEKATAADMENALCAADRIGRKHGLEVIAAPVGIGMYPEQTAAAKCGAFAVDLQFQANEVRPARYRALVRTAVRDIRAVSKRTLIIAGLGSNPSGFTASPQVILDSYKAVLPYVNGYWFNLPTWPDSTSPCGGPAVAGNTQATGCVYTGAEFMQLAGLR